MATIIWDGAAAGARPHRGPRRRARCTEAQGSRSRAARAPGTARCRPAARRLAGGVGVGVAVAGALALALVPGGDPSGTGSPAARARPVVATSASTTGEPVVGTYEVIERALDGTGDVTGLVAGLEGAAAGDRGQP
jgi:hypothetical protein